MARTPRKPRAESAQANAARGELELELGGTKYRLRPTMEAVQAIEQALDLSAEQILARANTSALLLDDLAVIIAELARAGAPDGPRGDLVRMASAQGMAPLIYRKGKAGVQTVITLLFIEIVSGGRDPEGNAVAVAGTMNNSTAQPDTAE
jgi:hypothetical protein